MAMRLGRDAVLAPGGFEAAPSHPGAGLWWSVSYSRLCMAFPLTMAVPGAPGRVMASLLDSG